MDFVRDLFQADVVYPTNQLNVLHQTDSQQDVLSEIFSRLAPRDLVALAEVNKQMHKFVMTKDHIWRAVCL